MQNSNTLNSFKITEKEHFRVLNNQQKEKQTRFLKSRKF